MWLIARRSRYDTAEHVDTLEAPSTSAHDRADICVEKTHHLISAEVRWHNPKRHLCGDATRVWSHFLHLDSDLGLFEYRKKMFCVERSPTVMLSNI
jgi:hypothetical protein